MTSTEKELVEYRCCGEQNGRACRHLLAKAPSSVALTIKCDRCKKINYFNQKAGLEKTPAV